MKGNFESIINSDTPVLIDFYADWCQPCKMQSPIVQEVAREFQGRVKVIKIDVDKNPQVSQRYQVQSIPTIMLFSKGDAVWRKAGVTSKNELIDVISGYSPR
ncbi:MAG TPA: thioredoxin [Bacteroidales bacterium]|nr:thioredoxin [Bacteroidales bacterium]